MSPAKASTSTDTIVTMTELVKPAPQADANKKEKDKSVDFSPISDDQPNKGKLCDDKLKLEVKVETKWMHNGTVQQVNKILCKIFQLAPVQEVLLGSVTTLSSPALRSSARVIQKMKMDSIRPVSPSQNDKKGKFCTHCQPIRKSI